MSLLDARKAVRAAISAVTQTLTLAERDAWRHELELLREAEESLTTRLNARAIRPASQLSLEVTR